jgi:peptidyl-prolyl cis-trans isomerase C
MHYKDSENYGTRSIFWVIPVIIGLVVFLPADSFALWPFSSKEPKKEYLAKVDDKIITEEEFSAAMRKLHMSGRVGKALKEKEGFAAQDYALFLDELIDNKLMVIEAENIGLDKEKDVVSRLDTFTLNLFLSRLRQEEVEEKVRVDDSEIEEYLNEELRKKQEEKALEEAEKDEEEVDKEGEGEEPKEITQEERAAAKGAIMQLKIKRREEEFFSQLRAKAKVSVEEEVLKDISQDKPELMEKAVARIDGEVVTVRDLLIATRGRLPEDLDERTKTLDRVILYKLLDKEAMSRGYENDPELKKKIEAYREKSLIDKFKKKLVPPLVKVEEDEILEYYESNKEEFREPDRINLAGIMVGSLEEAESVAKELKAGADFAFLAREVSLDSSRVKGGELGWVPAYEFHTDALTSFRQAAEGDILGPFNFRDARWVFEFHGIEKGSYIPLEKVRGKIDRIVGNQKYDSIFEAYLERLRASVTVDINKAELKRLQGQ